MLFLRSVLLPSLPLLSATCFSIPRSSAPSFPLEPNLIHEFPLSNYVNSLAVRKRDGDIMVSVATTSEIYLISTNHKFKPVKLATIPGVAAAIGIIETHVYEFYVDASNLPATAKMSTRGSFSIWRLDMKKKVSAIQPTKVADIKEATLLDRVTPFDSESLLASDGIGVLGRSTLSRGNPTPFSMKQPA
jgi:hypothetical protein